MHAATAARSHPERRRRKHPRRPRESRRPLDWGERLVSELARLFGRHGKPQVLRSTTGANSSQRASSTGSPSRGWSPRPSSRKGAAGKPATSSWPGEEFDCLTEARVVVGAWIETRSAATNRKPLPGSCSRARSISACFGPGGTASASTRARELHFGVPWALQILPRSKGSFRLNRPMPSAGVETLKKPLL